VNHSATDARDGVFRAAGIGRTDVGLTPSKSRVCVDSFVVVFGEVVPIYNISCYLLYFLGASDFAGLSIFLHTLLTEHYCNNNNITLLGSPGVFNCPAYSSLPRALCPYSLAVALRAFDPLSEIGQISVIGRGCYGRNAKEYSSLVSKSAEQRCPLLDRGIRQGKYPSISPPPFVVLAR